ncbi:urotensin-2 receptor [Scyliorhinus canicula]|uniref:urotensin-2 receptor n=1 Tax=Scyliorhinus canicula TaxID=7830 RepID=UPI0018F635AE|nr:urotensin-2 receptor [Scyliorhinus canicula]
MEAIVSGTPGNFSSMTNSSSSVLESWNEALITLLLGTVLTIMCLMGIIGNIYTLVVMTLSMRFAGSMYVYIVNLAFADLLYLATIPFVVCTYIAKDWYFGEVGCRILFSLDFLTMQASIFILTIMSTERYLAVVKPLATLRRNRAYRRIITCAVWFISFLLALPTMIMIDLRQFNKNGSVKRMCHSTWPKQAYKVYLTVLFHTCILAPGVVIGFLYTKLAHTYWISQTRIFNSKEVKRSPKHKILYMILTIVLAYCVCFLPFWVWQLFPLYYSEIPNLSPKTYAYVNFFVTCLAYGNSCINPFLYTLLTKNYKEYMTNQQRNSLEFSQRKQYRNSSQRSFSSGTQQCTEIVALN